MSKNSCRRRQKTISVPWPRPRPPWSKARSRTIWTRHGLWPRFSPCCRNMRPIRQNKRESPIPSVNCSMRFCTARWKIIPNISGRIRPGNLALWMAGMPNSPGKPQKAMMPPAGSFRIGTGMKTEKSPGSPWSTMKARRPMPTASAAAVGTSGPGKRARKASSTHFHMLCRGKGIG